MQAKLDQYKIFKTVADVGNISQAAARLYISQSAVSQSIKNLEDTLGVKLFSRSKKGVALTRDGSTLYEYVSTGLSIIETGEERLGESKELISGELVIGASNTITDSYLLPFLQQYHKQYPGVKVRILNGTSLRVTNHLSNALVDIAFVTGSYSNDSFSAYQCFETHTAFVCAHDYPIDFNKSYTLSEIATLPLILLEKEAGSRRFLEECFLKNGLRLEPEIELASYELLLSLARIGLGIAGITEEFSKDAINSGSICKLNLESPLPSRPVCMLTLNNTEPSMAAKKFMELIMDEIE